MQIIQANKTASISELKKSPAKIIKEAKGEAVAILNHNAPTAYLIPTALYDEMVEMLEEFKLIKEVKKP